MKLTHYTITEEYKLLQEAAKDSDIAKNLGIEICSETTYHLNVDNGGVTLMYKDKTNKGITRILAGNREALVEAEQLLEHILNGSKTSV